MAGRLSFILVTSHRKGGETYYCFLFQAQAVTDVSTTTSAVLGCSRLFLDWNFHHTMELLLWREREEHRMQSHLLLRNSAVLGLNTSIKRGVVRGASLGKPASQETPPKQEREPQRLISSSRSFQRESLRTPKSSIMLF